MFEQYTINSASGIRYFAMRPVDAETAYYVELTPGEPVSTVNQVSYLDMLKAREKALSNGFDEVGKVRLTIGKPPIPALKCSPSLDENGQLFPHLSNGFKSWEHPDNKCWGIRQVGRYLDVWWRSGLSDQEWIHIRSTFSTPALADVALVTRERDKKDKGYIYTNLGGYFLIDNAQIVEDIPF